MSWSLLTPYEKLETVIFSKVLSFDVTAVEVAVSFNPICVLTRAAPCACTQGPLTFISVNELFLQLAITNPG